MVMKKMQQPMENVQGPTTTQNAPRDSLTEDTQSSPTAAPNVEQRSQ